MSLSFGVILDYSNRAKTIATCTLYFIVATSNVGYGVPNVSKTLTNAIFVYLPLIYKCDTDLAKYLPDLLYI